MCTFSRARWWPVICRMCCHWRSTPHSPAWPARPSMCACRRLRRPMWRPLPACAIPWPAQRMPSVRDPFCHSTSTTWCRRFVLIRPLVRSCSRLWRWVSRPWSTPSARWARPARSPWPAALRRPSPKPWPAWSWAGWPTRRRGWCLALGPWSPTCEQAARPEVLVSRPHLPRPAFRWPGTLICPIPPLPVPLTAKSRMRRPVTKKR